MSVGIVMMAHAALDRAAQVALHLADHFHLDVAARNRATGQGDAAAFLDGGEEVGREAVRNVGEVGPGEEDRHAVNFPVAGRRVLAGADLGCGTVEPFWQGRKAGRIGSRGDPHRVTEAKRGQVGHPQRTAAPLLRRPRRSPLPAIGPGSLSPLFPHLFGPVPQNLQEFIPNRLDQRLQILQRKVARGDELRDRHAQLKQS